MPTRRRRPCVSSARLRAAAAERRRLAAAGTPRVQPAVEDRPCVEADRAEHACGDSRPGAALADRHDRPVADEPVLSRLPGCAVRKMRAPRNEAAVALVRLANVVEQDLVRREPPLELVDRHRFHALVASTDPPTDQVEY